jgi:hypothetical protein
MRRTTLPRFLFPGPFLCLSLYLFVACSHAPPSGPAAPPARDPTAGFPAAAEPTCARSVPVAGASALAAALAAARPGDCLLLADGEYRFPEPLTLSGTAAQPIAVRAEHRLGAVVSAGSIVVERSAYLVLEGLRFSASGNIRFHDSAGCRLTRWRIEPQEAADRDWVDVEGSSHHIRIDHNDFGPQHLVGNMLMLGGNKPQVVQHNRIDHNLFHDISYGGGNGWETIRAGLSFLAPSSGFNVIEDNLFRNAAGDPETISIKSSDNVIRFNTLRATPGEITLRHGNRNQVYGNYILGAGAPKAGGIRICGADHRIYNNYVAEVKAGPAIFLEGGDGDGTDVPGKQHYRVYRTQVVNNTVVGASIQVGGAHPLAPVDCVVANNLVQDGAIVEKAGMGTRYLGNLVAPSPAAEPRLQTASLRPPAEVRMIDARLQPAGEVFRLAGGSPAVDAAAGGFDFVVEDIDGQRRQRNDVGADELSTAPVLHAPLTEKDVGPGAP